MFWVSFRVFFLGFSLSFYVTLAAIARRGTQTNLVPAAFESENMADMIRSITDRESEKVLETRRESEKVQKTRGDSCSTVSVVESEGNLPEEVVEEIISGIPFPTFFKARLLSRTWWAKLHCTEPLSAYQNLVSSVSSKWAKYCPVYVGKEAILGFERVSSRWQTLMNISHLPISAWFCVTSAGPLVCVLSGARDSSENLVVYVTNALTRDLRTLNFGLPAPPGENSIIMKITLQGSHAYEVLIVFRDEDRVHSYIYNSASKTYKKHTFVEVSSSRIYATSAYLNGKLYCMFGCWAILGPATLWVYNVENNEWSGSAIPDSHFGWPRRSDVFYEVVDCGVLLCGDKVMVAVVITSEYIDPDRYQGMAVDDENIHIYELDVVTLEMKLVSLGPRACIFGVGVRDGQREMTFASDSNFIYFGHYDPGTELMSYNIESHEWTYLELPPAFHNLPSTDWMTVAFQPGLCPFFTV